MVARRDADLLGRADLVVDCTPKRIAAQNVEIYRACGLKFIVQGVEKHEVTGHSFVAEVSFESAVGRTATRVVSCNTTSIVRTLTALKRASRVELHTDSQYVRQGITTWIHQWKRRGWTTADRKPVKNVDLWQRLDALAATHHVDWRWVKGHAGDPGNERADALANRGADAQRQ